jgi:hypothetical protein
VPWVHVSDVSDCSASCVHDSNCFASFYDALRSEARRKEKEKAKAGTSSGGGGGGRGELKSSGSGGQRAEGGVSVSTLKRAAAQPLSQASAKVVACASLLMHLAEIACLLHSGKG